jgi:hypothetical protein
MRRPARKPSTPATNPLLDPADPSLIEVRLRGTFGHHWMQELASRWGATIQLHVCRPERHDAERLVRLLQVVAPATAMGEIRRYLREEVGPDQVSFTPLARDRLLVWCTGPLPALCKAVFDVGGVCTTCPYLPGADGEARGTWGMLVPYVAGARDPLRATREGLDHLATVTRVGRYRGPRELTPRQERALDVAYRIGYLGHPRRASLKDLAQALGVNRSTALEILRRGLMKLAAQHYRQTVPVAEWSRPADRSAFGHRSPD